MWKKIRLLVGAGLLSVLTTSAWAEWLVERQVYTVAKQERTLQMIVADKTLYALVVVAAGDPQENQRLVAFDRASAKVIWEKTMAQPACLMHAEKAEVLAYAPPGRDKQRGYGLMLLAAKTGQEAHWLALDGPVTGGVYLPDVEKFLVVTASEGEGGADLLTLLTPDGKTIWTTRAEGKSVHLARADKNKIMAVSWGGGRPFMFALETSTGKLLWKKDLPSDEEMKADKPPTLATDPDPARHIMVSILDGHGVAYISAENGTLVHVTRFPAGIQGAQSDFPDKPSLVLVRQHTTGNALIALRNKDGQVAWRIDQPSDAHETFALYQSAVGMWHGNVAVLAGTHAHPGPSTVLRQIWFVSSAGEIVGKFGADESLQLDAIAPVGVGEELFVAHDGKISAVKREHGGRRK